MNVGPDAEAEVARRTKRSAKALLPESLDFLQDIQNSPVYIQFVFIEELPWR